MTKRNEIETAIKAEIQSHKDNEDYVSTDQYYVNSIAIFKALEISQKYDCEKDEDFVAFSLGAEEEEAWQYLLDNVIDHLEDDSDIRFIECECGNIETMDVDEQRWHSRSFRWIENLDETTDGQAMYQCECARLVTSTIK